MSDIANVELPKHQTGLSVGIIMDGNGRWAASRGLPRFEGHRRGVEALRAAVRAAPDLGVRYLTLYSFSLENWSRPKREVLDLMGLLKRFIRNDLAELHKSNVQIKVIGEPDGLSADILALLAEAQDLTRNNSRLTLVIAFNYGSRQEIVGAVQAIARRALAGEIDPKAIDVDMISRALQTATVPDPDFIIRTSGEQRLSNFLLWQAAYAEFIFLPIHWPDFDQAAFTAAISEFNRRDRRFGGLVRAVEPDLSAKTAS
ncbi:MAG: isoprenyl transferase [Hyphomicrobiales bacterium]|nr:isoprenyl transferase [Hyphomicrobiales bacterium]MDE2114219.1 isoprenyl transferase [Hyphomicrobiales bacterium]